MEGNWKDPSKRALFVSEIVTISLLGRTEDVERLDRMLDEASPEELQRALIDLADKIRSRHDMGLRKDCCASCKRYENCDLKWLKVERSMRPTCCPRCQKFHECLKSHQDDERAAARRRRSDAAKAGSPPDGDASSSDGAADGAADGAGDGA